jgi:hypothetical protein
MRTIWSIAILTLGVSVACAGRTAAPAAGAPQPQSTGAQAAAKVTLQEYDALEKKIGDGFPVLQMHIAAQAGEDAAKEAEQLAIAFGDIEQFWAQNNRADAAKWAQDSAMFASQIAGAATAGDLTRARQAAANMQRTCNQCHRAYRQTDPAGGFAIKAGVVRQ